VIKVPEGLETAYEVALGSALQNLITANEEDAKRIIAWLKNTNGGRVTFLPLDTVRGGEFSGEELALLKRPGVLGGALELIDFAPPVSTCSGCPVGADRNHGGSRHRLSPQAGYAAFCQACD